MSKSKKLETLYVFKISGWPGLFVVRCGTFHWFCVLMLLLHYAELDVYDMFLSSNQCHQKFQY